MEHIIKHKLILLTIAIQLVALPVILYAVKQNQDTRTKATAGTTLSFTPATQNINLGTEFRTDLMVNPGTNLVSLIKLEITYDPAKLTPSVANPITINSTAFPSIVEGPIYAPGSIKIIVSVGGNQQNVIQAPTKVLTASFKANATAAPTSVGFGPGNVVYSIAAQDRSNENVLATTVPAVITINAAPTPTPTIRPTNTPTPTIRPTSTPTPTVRPSQTPTPTVRPSQTPTPTIRPTGIPSGTPAPTPGKTIINLTGLKLHGLGRGGDSPNPNTDGTLNPLRPQRTITLGLYNANDILVTSFTGAINFNSNTGDFSGRIEAPDTINSGNYLVRIKTDQYLRRKIPGFINLNKGAVNTPVSTTMVSGDINGDNSLNISDYEILMGCYSDLRPAKSCDAAKKALSDLTDDGKVNHDDYNLFLRELSVQQGE